MKKTTAPVNPVLKTDVLRYKKNKFASTMALLGIVFDALYFTLLFSANNIALYTPLLGISVIVNLLVMLAAFYSSEGVKNYTKLGAILLFVLAGLQFIRMFIFPIIGLVNYYYDNCTYLIFLSLPNIIVVLLMWLYLAGSIACFIVSGVHGLLTLRKLTKFKQGIESGEINVEDTLRQLDEEDAAKAAAQVAEEPATEVAEEPATACENNESAAEEKSEGDVDNG